MGKITLTAVALVVGLSSLLTAQGEAPQVDIQELARQIHRNMRKVEEELAKLDAANTSKTSDQVRKDMDELLKSLGGRGQQIATDMDELIKNWPQGNGSGGGGGGQSQSSQGKSGSMPKDGSSSRDRNRPQNSGGKKPDGQNQKEPQTGQKPSGGAEDNTQPNPQGGENSPAEPRREDRARARHINIEDRWGTLPPELKQQLLDGKVRDFSPEYRAAIERYLKRLASPEK